MSSGIVGSVYMYDERPADLHVAQPDAPESKIGHNSPA
jgi:hypothetical protein